MALVPLLRVRWRLVALIVLILAGGYASTAIAQAPSSLEAQAIWDSFWARVLAGDLRGAYRYVHSSRLGFVLQRPEGQLQDMAGQMQYCRLRPEPLAISGEDVLFEVHCEHGTEKADTLVGFRQDSDGVWRLTVI